MSFFGAVAIGTLFLLAIFTVANWAVLSAPSLLSFVFFDFQGPLGVILLCVVLAMAGLFALYALSLRTAMLMESRRHKQELEAQRKLAENAEASRLNEFRAQMEQEFAQLRSAIDQAGERTQNVETALHKTLSETTNGLAANIGEIEDKLDKVLAAQPA